MSYAFRKGDWTPQSLIILRQGEPGSLGINQLTSLSLGLTPLIPWAVHMLSGVDIRVIKKAPHLRSTQFPLETDINPENHQINEKKNHLPNLNFCISCLDFLADVIEVKLLKYLYS